MGGPEVAKVTPWGRARVSSNEEWGRFVKRIIILGVGGNCVDILDAIFEINEGSPAPRYECVGFLDDDPQTLGRKFAGVPVLGSLLKANEYPDCVFVNGIGSPENFWKKSEIIARTGVPDARFETIVHPTASVSRLAVLGPGCVVLQNATIASCARLGRHVIVLPNSIVSHDCTVGDFTCIAGGASISGGVVIGASCYLGANSAIKGNLRIGDGSLIGMGAVVLRDVSENTVVVGNPARRLRSTR